MSFTERSKRALVRVMGYIVLILMLIGGWRIVNAQQTTTVCHAVGQQIICQTMPQVQVPLGPAFDPSVIGGISTPTPEELRYFAIRQCMRRGIAEGLTDEQILARCVK